MTPTIPECLPSSSPSKPRNTAGDDQVTKSDLDSRIILSSAGDDQVTKSDLDSRIILSS